MGKLLFTSDLHCEKGLRVQICINFLDYIEQYCLDNDIRDIVFGGDILNKSSSIKNETFLPLFLRLMDMKNKGINLFFILGNHDIFNKDNDSIAMTFSSFGTVVRKNATINIAGYDYDLLSYTEKKDEIMEQRSPTLLTHLPIMNFYYDNGFGDENIMFNPEDFAGYDKVITGHFHKKQENGNIIYPGAPYQLTFGEEGHNKYFAIVEGPICELISYNEAPTFLTIKIEDFKNYEYKNKFVRVKISKKIENFVKLKHILYEQGAIEISPMYEKEENTDDGEHTIDINANMVVSAKKFIKDIKKEGIDNKKLAEYFEKVLAEVK